MRAEHASDSYAPVLFLLVVFDQQGSQHLFCPAAQSQQWVIRVDTQ
jgi:hypothetical protein